MTNLIETAWHTKFLFIKLWSSIAQGLLPFLMKTQSNAFVIRLLSTTNRSERHKFTRITWCFQWNHVLVSHHNELGLHNCFSYLRDRMKIYMYQNHLSCIVKNLTVPIPAIRANGKAKHVDTIHERCDVACSSPIFYSYFLPMTYFWNIVSAPVQVCCGFSNG